MYRDPLAVPIHKRRTKLLYEFRSESMPPTSFVVYVYVLLNLILDIITGTRPNRLPLSICKKCDMVSNFINNTFGKINLAKKLN